MVMTVAALEVDGKVGDPPGLPPYDTNTEASADLACHPPNHRTLAASIHRSPRADEFPTMFQPEAALQFGKRDAIVDCFVMPVFTQTDA